MDPPKIPRLRLVIPKAATTSTTSTTSSDNSANQRPATANMELISSLPSVPTVALNQCIQRAVQWTFRQVESFHELLPRMGDVERRHSLSMLARQCHALWKEVKLLCDLSTHSMERLQLAVKGIEYLKEEETNRSRAVQELEYQNYVMPSCVLPAHPCRHLLQVQSDDASFAFPWDISRFLPQDSIKRSLSHFVRKEAFNFLSENFPQCARIISITEKCIQVEVMEEFILEFTIAPAAPKEHFVWFLLRASVRDAKLAAQVGNSLTGMLQHRPMASLRRDLEVYRNFCFLQQIYLQLQDARRNVKLTMDSGPGSLKATLWGNPRASFEFRIHQATGKLDFVNVALTCEIRASPFASLVEELIDQAAMQKFRKFASKVKLWASAALSMQESGGNALCVTSQKIDQVALNFWLDRRTGRVHCDHAWIKTVGDEVDLQFITDHFNHHILNGIAQERMETPMAVIRSELNKWNLRDARLFTLKEEPDLAVALALTLHPVKQTLIEQLVLLEKDSIGITRIIDTKQQQQQAQGNSLSAAEDYLLDYRLNMCGLCVDKLTGEIVNAALAQGIVRLLLEPATFHLIVEYDDNEKETTEFQKWQDIPQMITNILEKKK